MPFLACENLRLKTGKDPPPTWTPRTLGEHLRHRRQTLGWSQARAAKAIGLYATNYSDWERGAVREPQMALWPGILRFLGYDPICAEPTTLTDQIGYLCRHLGISRERLGKRLRVTGHTVYEWEFGRLTPTASHRALLLDLLGTFVSAAA